MPETVDGRTPAEQEADWQTAVAQAADVARKTMGAEAGNLERIIGASQKPKVDWRGESRHWLHEICQSDYSWRLPSRRLAFAGVYMPSLSEPRVGTLVVARDTSGSIGADELRRFNGEIRAIADELKPRQVILIDCDARVRKVWEIGDGEPLPDLSRGYGGGGTSFVPVFKYIEDMDEPPVAAIYLTDLAGRFPAKEPDVPTLWVSTTDGTAPFGRTTHING